MLNKLIRPNCFYRGIAIFFLLFTVFDLTLTPNCNEDGPAMLFISHETDRGISLVASFAPASSDQSDHQSAPGAEEHDCFCCCAHLTLVDGIQMGCLINLSEAVPRSLTNLPVAPAQQTDHPPRLA